MYDGFLLLVAIPTLIGLVIYRFVETENARQQIARRTERKGKSENVTVSRDYKHWPRDSVRYNVKYTDANGKVRKTKVVRTRNFWGFLSDDDYWTRRPPR